MAHEEDAGPVKTRARKIGLLLGGILFMGILLLDLDPGNPAPTRMAAVAALMAVWWITDAIPLYATALLPMVLYPLLGILSGGRTAPVYINSTIFLFIGGFMIALAMESWGLHRRIALVIIRAIGGGPSRIVLGFMLAAAFLSMQIHPLMLMIPATLSASHAFMMPVATPPNAIVFGSQRLQIREMARIGVFINLAGIVVITAVFYLLGTLVFNI